MPIKVDSSNLAEDTDTSFSVIMDKQTRINNSNALSNVRKGGWSKEEDMELHAAVEKWGEGNWTEMAARDDFPLNRTAAQLSKVSFYNSKLFLFKCSTFHFIYCIGLIYLKCCLQRWRILRNKFWQQ